MTFRSEDAFSSLQKVDPILRKPEIGVILHGPATKPWAIEREKAIEAVGKIRSIFCNAINFCIYNIVVKTYD